MQLAATAAACFGQKSTPSFDHIGLLSLTVRCINGDLCLCKEGKAGPLRDGDVGTAGGR